MISSQKILAFLSVVMVLLVLFPAVILSCGVQPRDFSPPAGYRTMTVAAALSFLAGAGLSHAIFPFRFVRPLFLPELNMVRLYSVMIAIAVIVCFFLYAFGPPSVLARTLAGASPDAIAHAREAAVKLNPSRIQVRAFVLARDVIAPLLVIVGCASFSGAGRYRPLAIVGVLVAFFLLTWSGQKSPLLNSLLAIVIWRGFTARELFSRRAFQGAGVILLILLLLFFDLKGAQLAFTETAYVGSRLLDSIAQRLFIVPFAVSSTYIYASDSLGIVSWQDAIPSYAWLWQPAAQTIDATIGQMFYHAGFSSTLSGGLAFAYAYVTGGLAGCLLLGFVTPQLLRASLFVVSWSGRPALTSIFSAYLCYFLIDIVQANSLQYLINNLVFACMVAPLGFLLPRAPAGAGSSFKP